MFSLTKATLTIGDSRNRPLYTGAPNIIANQTNDPDANATANTLVLASNPEDPTQTFQRRLDDLFDLAERIKTHIDSLVVQQTIPPDPQLNEEITAALLQHQDACIQYQQIVDEWTQTRSIASTANHGTTPLIPAPLHKRPASDESLQDDESAKRARMSGSTSDSSAEEASSPQWGPGNEVKRFSRNNAVRLEKELDEPTIKALALIGSCDSAAEMNGVVPQLKAAGFVGLLKLLLEPNDPPLTEAAGHLALTMLLFYCADDDLVLPELCSPTMSQALNGLGRYPREDEYDLQGTSFDRLADQPEQIRAALAALLNRTRKHH